MRSTRVVNGYRLIYKPDHPSCMKGGNWNGYVYEHRYLMEIELGRELLPDEIVHHLDCEKTNNRLENLIVISKRYHARLHSWINSGANVSESFVRNGINSGKPLSEEPKCCEICGQTLQAKQKYWCCLEHASLGKRKVERPTFEQLKLDMSSMSMLAIGKKYNVSDNAVRKWIKTYSQGNPEPSLGASSKEGAETSGGDTVVT